MIIRKLFKFENAHIVRNCSSERCKYSIHGHSYKIEVLLESDILDHGQMVYDFGLMKTTIKDLIDSFDHAIAFWDQDNADYLTYCKQFSLRWISMPVSPSAEQFSRMFFLMVDAIIKNTIMQNGEENVKVNSVIVHETDTGYAQAFYKDAYNPKMGEIKLENIIFSDAIKQDWRDVNLFDNLIKKIPFENPKNKLQVIL